MAEIDRLTVVFDARFDKLEDKLNKAIRATYGASSKMTKSLQTVDTQWSRLFGKTDPIKAMDKVFDSTRFRVLDTGAAKIGLFGSALESLGPVGLAAAAAIGAVGLAFHQAREAARFADDIADTAKQAHVTTDALQEFRYAIRAAGGDEAGADEALQSFSATLGKAQEGLAKSQKAFLALKFTKEDIRNFKDADDALLQVTDRIARLGSNAQKDAVIQQLGLDGLKPLVEDGVAQMQKLRDEAHKLGIVMDAQLVKRGGDLNDEFETLSKVIDAQLKSAFVDLGPVLVELLKGMAEMAKLAADVADAFKSIEHRRTDRLKELQQEFQARADSPLGKILPGLRDHDLQRAAEIKAELDKRAKEAKAPALGGGGGDSLADLSTARKQSGPSPAQQLKRFHELLQRQERELVDAHDAAIRDAEDHAGFASERLDIEREARSAELADLVATKAITQQQADILAAKDAELDAARQSTVMGEARMKIEEERLGNQREVLSSELEILGIASDLATTAAERRSLQLRMLELDRAQLRQQLEHDLRLRPGLLAGDRETILGNFDKTTDQMRTQIERNTRGPLEAFIAQTSEAGDRVEDLAVNGLQALNDGLVDAILNARSLGDVAKNVFRQIASDLISALVRQNITGPLASLLKVSLPGHAMGTNYASGGWSIVGEQGPEIVNLPRGSQVISNSQVNALANMRAAPSAVSVQTIFDNRGAVLWDQKAAELMAYADHRALQAGAGAVQASRGLVASDFRRRARRTI